MSAMASQITDNSTVQQFIQANNKEQITPKLRITSPVTGRIPSQRASNVESVFISWRHHILICKILKTIEAKTRQMLIIIKTYSAMEALRKREVLTSLYLTFCRSSFVIIK